MTRLKSVLFISAAIVLLGVNPSRSKEPDWTPTEGEIWALEEQYMAKLSANDLEGLSQLWHEDFIGWPSHSPEPVHRAAAEASLRNLFQSLDIVDCEIRRRAMYCNADLAVAYYTVIFRARMEDGNLLPAAYRITHVWILAGGVWKLVGGMSAEDNNAQ
jgi:ketosteroid isomerase-like protein